MNIREEARLIVELYREVDATASALDAAQQAHYEAKHHLAIAPIAMSREFAEGILAGIEHISRHVQEAYGIDVPSVQE